MRVDLDIIGEWIPANSRVLDLGCGDGTLMAQLQREKNVSGYGVEIDDDNIARCIEKGVRVIQTDIDDGLSAYFDEDSFDYVVMSQTLQAMLRPDQLLEEMLRVSKNGIVTFPNMGYWKARLQFAMAGHMPVTRKLPYQWYDTPNIHLCTLNDFETLCANHGITVLDRRVVDHAHRSSLGQKLLPNLLGEIALYRFTRS